MKALYTLKSSKNGCNFLRKLELAQSDSGVWFSRNNYATGSMCKWQAVEVTEFCRIDAICTKHVDIIECRINAGTKQRMESYPKTMELPSFRLPKV